MTGFGRNFLRAAKNYTCGYTRMQAKVRHATSNSKSGPGNSLMSEIAEATYDPQKVVEILEIVHKRLNDSGKNWRHVFKSLLLLDYLLRMGSETVVFYVKSNKYVIKTLRHFEYIDESGCDQGANVRQKSRNITSLIEDEDKLQSERNLYSELRPANAGPSLEEQNDLRKAIEMSKAMRDTDSCDDDNLKLALEISKREAEIENQRKFNEETRLEPALNESKNSLAPGIDRRNSQNSDIYNKLLVQHNAALDEKIGLLHSSMAQNYLPKSMSSALPNASINSLPNASGLPQNFNALPENINALSNTSGLPQNFNALPENINVLPNASAAYPNYAPSSYTSTSYHGYTAENVLPSNRKNFETSDPANVTIDPFELLAKKVETSLMDSITTSTPSRTTSVNSQYPESRVNSQYPEPRVNSQYPESRVNSQYPESRKQSFPQNQYGNFYTEPAQDQFPIQQSQHSQPISQHSQPSQNSQPAGQFSIQQPQNPIYQHQELHHFQNNHL